VGDPAQGEEREVLDAVVPAVDEEREPALIDLLDDLAERPPGGRVVAAPGVNPAR
jgi:hypothetical protein